MKYYTQQEIIDLYKEVRWFREVYKFYKILFGTNSAKDKKAFEVAMNIVLMNKDEIEKSGFNPDTEFLLAFSDRIQIKNKKDKSIRTIMNIVKIDKNIQLDKVEHQATLLSKLMTRLK